MPIYIVRSIDIVLENRTERIQALRLVRKFLSISPRLFPPAFTRSLVAIAQDGLDEHDTLTRACWALLAELSIMCPKSTTKDTQNNAFNAIMDATLSGNQPHGMCESLISTLLYMLNWPSYRCLIRGEPDLQIFVAPFTDSHYSAPTIKNQKQGLNQSTKFDVDPYDQREHKFNAAKITLISILRSWPGLIYLCEPQEFEVNLVTKSCLKSLINMLYLPYNDVRRRLIDLLFELLYLPLPDSSLDFDSGLKFLEKHQLSKDSWKIHDAFIVDEASALLTPMRSRIRMNLLNDYMALLLLALFQCNVVDALSEVIVTPFSQENSNRATILLYELLSLSYQYLPTDSFSKYLTLSTLIAHATSKADDSRDLANAALINLGRIKPSKKPLQDHANTKYSLFLGQLLEFCSPHLLVDGKMSSNLNSKDDKCRTNYDNSMNDTNYDVHDSGDNNPTTSCNSISNTLTINSLSTLMSNSSNISGGQHSNSSSTSSTSTLVNSRANQAQQHQQNQQQQRHLRSPSISSRSPSILSKASTLTNATSLFTLFSFQSASKTSLKTMAESNWQSWEWEHINFILTRPCESLRKLSNHHYRSFIKKLVQFYKPSSNQYSMIEINNECNRQLCDTGCKLIDFLVASSEVKAIESLEELLHDISISMHDPESTYNNHHHQHNMNSSTRLANQSSPRHVHIDHNHLIAPNSNSNFNNSSSNQHQNNLQPKTTITRSTLITTATTTTTSSINQQQQQPQQVNNIDDRQIIFNTHLNHAATLPLTSIAHNSTSTGPNNQQIPSITKQSEVNILSSAKLISTMSSTYFLFIGRLSSSLRGYQLLEKTDIIRRINNLTQLSMPSSSPAEVYVRLIISCFDYTKEYNGSRKLLEKFLFDHPEESVRLYATNFLRVLLRANVQDYSHWAMELLVKQLCSSMRVIHFAAADILDEACDFNSHLEGLISLKSVINPQTKTKSSIIEILRNSKDVGVILLSRYASLPSGLKYLIETPRECLSMPLDEIITDQQDATDKGTSDALAAASSTSISKSSETELAASQTDSDSNSDSANPVTATATATGAAAASSGKSSKRSSSPMQVQMDSEFDVELTRWQTHLNYRYVKLIEDVLNDSLTYHQKGEDGKYGRRIDRINPMTKNSYIPPHLYGQLAQHSEGCEILQSRRLLQPALSILKSPPEDLNYSEVSLLKFKAALWIIGHVGSSPLGYQLFGDSRELLRLVTGFARDGLVLSLRGTAFYVIGLLGSTSEGADELREFGWIVQSDDVIALPVSLDLILKKPNDEQFEGRSGNNSSNKQQQSVKSFVTSSDDDNGSNSPQKTTNQQLPTVANQDTSSKSKTTSSSPNISAESNNDCLIQPQPKLPDQLANKYKIEELEQIRRDIMKYVANLSGQLAYRTAENSLLEFKRKYGDIFQYDVSLYSQVCQQLARCNFRLQARRFLQELFLDTVV